jgi:hypothetical protein
VTAGDVVPQASIIFEGTFAITSPLGCKDGGWESLRLPDSHPLFKNQGDCIRFIQTHH